MPTPLIFEGKRFISAKRAAEITGYTSDYIGQISRAGKVESRIVGRARFVEEESLMRYYDSYGSKVGGNTPSLSEEHAHPPTENGHSPFPLASQPSPHVLDMT